MPEHPMLAFMMWGACCEDLGENYQRILRMREQALIPGTHEFQCLFNENEKIQEYNAQKRESTRLQRPLSLRNKMTPTVFGRLKPLERNPDKKRNGIDWFIY